MKSMLLLMRYVMRSAAGFMPRGFLGMNVGSISSPILGRNGAVRWRGSACFEATAQFRQTPCRHIYPIRRVGGCLNCALRFRAQNITKHL